MRHTTRHRKGFAILLMALGVRLLLSGVLLAWLNTRAYTQTGQPASSIADGLYNALLADSATGSQSLSANEVIGIAPVLSSPESVLALWGISTLGLTKTTAALLRLIPLRYACIGIGAMLMGIGMMLLAMHRNHRGIPNGSPGWPMPPQPATCAACHAPLRANARFCGMCGQLVDSRSMAHPQG